MNLSKKYGVIFVVYGIACLVMAMTFSSRVSDEIKQTFSPEGGKFGPIETLKENEVYNIGIHQNMRSHYWSAVEGEVVDEDWNFLVSFSDELWYETGYDSEGAWSEGKLKYDISITFPKPGKYFILIKSTNENPASVEDIYITAYQEFGSHIIFTFLGWISLTAGCFILYSNRARSLQANETKSTDTDSSSDQVKKGPVRQGRKHRKRLKHEKS